MRPSRHSAIPDSSDLALVVKFAPSWLLSARAIIFARRRQSCSTKGCVFDWTPPSIETALNGFSPFMWQSARALCRAPLGSLLIHEVRVRFTFWPPPDRARGYLKGQTLVFGLTQTIDNLGTLLEEEVMWPPTRHVLGSCSSRTSSGGKSLAWSTSSTVLSWFHYVYVPLFAVKVTRDYQVLHETGSGGLRDAENSAQLSQGGLQIRSERSENRSLSFGRRSARYRLPPELSCPRLFGYLFLALKIRQEGHLYCVAEGKRPKTIRKWWSIISLVRLP